MDTKLATKFFLGHLSEYYDVPLEEALKLGTRGAKRKPILPGSKTCSPVSGVTMEDLWGFHPRKTQSDIFGFYRDQGAWSSFRQCVRLLEITEQYRFLLDASFKGMKEDDIVVCEYGCGVAPFSFLLLNGM